LQADQRHAAALRLAFCLKPRENAGEVRWEAAPAAKRAANCKSAHEGSKAFMGAQQAQCGGERYG